MKLDFASYRDKVMGCWTGKNIGGVLGMPFEGFRQVNEVDFYTQDLSNGPPPNDDLDLQIVWLAAVERFGRHVNASILGEYWLSYVIPNWVEYGTGKANLRAGLVPPMSGMIDNAYRNSCGCFIRSELWACLCPGNPELAARYALEDGMVDHGEEGLFGEVFFAALQSAAFVENDPQRLLQIALSYIPEDCLTARAVREAVCCREEGVSLRQARVRVHNIAPGTFGIQNEPLSCIPVKDNEEMAVGTAGMDAPENVAFAILGWLYGEGDFGRAICAANFCGEDTDCTCASLGALLGILYGASGIPEKWKAPLNDLIATVCIDKTSWGVWVPKTVTELTDRILRVVPGFLGTDLCDLFAEGGYAILCQEGDGLLCSTGSDRLPQINGNGVDQTPSVREKCASPFVIRQEFPAFQVDVDLGGSPFVGHGEKKTLKVTVRSQAYLRQQHWARITLYAGEGVFVEGVRQMVLPLNYNMGCRAEAVFDVNLDECASGKAEILVDVALEGRHSTGAVKAVLFRGVPQKQA